MSAARMAASRRGNEGSSSMTRSRAPTGEQVLVLHIALRIASALPVADDEGPADTALQPPVHRMGRGPIGVEK
jgi:hypothetical protein